MSIKRQSQYLDYLVDPSLPGLSTLFGLPFEDNAVRTGHTRYFLPTVKIKNYNVTTDGQNFFDQLLKNYFEKYDRKLQLVKEIITQQVAY